MKMRKPRKNKWKIAAIIAIAVLIGCAVTFLIVGMNRSEEKKLETKATTEEAETMPDIEIETEAETTAAQTTALPNSNYTKYQNGEEIELNSKWEYANFSAINTGKAVYYKATTNFNGMVVAVNAGHGTKGGSTQKTFCHPDKTPKVTGGSTAEGSTTATAVAGGMSFNDGTSESYATLAIAKILKDKLLAKGYNVLMLRDSDDVQLDNVARTVIANNVADIHISLHYDGDGLDYDKGAFYIGVPDGIKYLPTVSKHWQNSEALGASIIKAFSSAGIKIHGEGRSEIDLTQTSYSTIPSVDLELGNQCSDLSNSTLSNLADNIVVGVDGFFGNN